MSFPKKKKLNNQFRKNQFIIFLTFFLTLFFSCATNKLNLNQETIPSYEETFSNQYKKGIERAKKIEQILVQKKNCSEQKAHFATAIIFPELTRYDNKTAKLEIYAVKYLKKDYSIGMMQMKPIFAIEIEKQLNNFEIEGIKLSEKYSVINFLGKNENAKDKKNRINRLSNLEMQCEYLLAFVDIFSQLKNRLPEGKENLRIFATAYNAGFQRSDEELFGFMQATGFPYGGRNSRSHWNYATIAESYFN